MGVRTAAAELRHRLRNGVGGPGLVLALDRVLGRFDGSAAELAELEGMALDLVETEALREVVRATFAAAEPGWALGGSDVPARRENRPGPSLSYFAIGDEPVDDATEWIIDQVLPVGVTLVTGQPKTGKSLLSLYLCVCVTGGVDAFGRYRVEQPGCAIYASGEDTRRRIGARAQRFARGFDLDPAHLPLVACPPQGLRLDSQDPRLDELADLAADSSARIVVFDPTIRFHGGDENRTRDVSPMLGALRLLSEQLHAAVVLVRHDRRPVEGDAKRRPGERSRGSGDFYAVADGTWGVALARKSDHGLDIAMAFEAKDGGGVIEGVAEMRWPADRIEVQWVPGVTADDSAMADARNRIINALKDAGGELPSQAALEQAVGGTRETTRRALHGLEAEGAVLIEPGARNAHRLRLRRTGTGEANGPPELAFPPTSPDLADRHRRGNPADDFADLAGPRHGEVVSTSPLSTRRGTPHTAQDNATSPGELDDARGVGPGLESDVPLRPEEDDAL